ncbi:uncharacterized protein EV420DRAFT_1743456 [Desarmillaria tabescens]|uniref:RING-type domain-containing protein n=1 Tax=Armillaria tabescens TaxID=1929756 RepID=A0AA39NJP4_ARMTA|nr:uncharacterized protein EV420DRAFT_1743456 [Desarmillaria tabescens]KAK0466866.1 hypothetical protein EV420DRAFT_1743456 [Desarmillaria tabescens]
MSTSCVCSICLSDFADPVCMPCGHVYCSNCIAQATSVLRNEGLTTAHALPVASSFLYLSRDFHECFGYPLRRLYVNGIRVNFEDQMKRLEERIASLERENQSLRYQDERYGRSVPWLARTLRTGSGFPSWMPREDRNVSSMKWLASAFVFGLTMTVGFVAGFILYDAFGTHPVLNPEVYYG